MTNREADRPSSDSESLDSRSVPSTRSCAGGWATKADKLKAWALAQVGSPYVMDGTGQPCTPAYRQARAEQYPASAAAIRRNCPVLRGKKAACGGCKYDGKRCYDCAQLVRRGCAAAGIEGVAISGATSQWRKGDWLRKGSIADAPAGQVCVLFREDRPGNMGHTGIALGDGTIVHASGHDTGVIRTAISAGRWTHYAIPRGMDAVVDGETDAPSESAPGTGGNSSGTEQRDTIRRGAKGPTVVEAQGLLLRAGYSLPKHGADGSFGAETEAAVKAFQQAHGLTVDGIVGPKTWAALGRAASGAVVIYTVTIPGLSREQAEKLAGLYPGATIQAGGAA